MAKPLTDVEFVELLTSSQVRLRAYAISLMPFGNDADDILQKACLAMWEKRSEYDAEREFFRWACGVVLIEVLRMRRQKAKEKLVFGDVLINTLAADYVANAADFDNRRAHLDDCVKRLAKKDREMIIERYRYNILPKEISKKRGVAITTIYSALTRARESLRRCINSKMLQESRF